MIEGRIRLTEDRVTKMRDTITYLLRQTERFSDKLVRARVLASIVGQIISTQAVLNNEVRLRSRFSYNCILTKAGILLYY